VLQIINHADYLNNVGNLCVEQGLNRKAKVYFQQAFRISPYPETAQRLVVLFLKDDQPDKALPYLIYLERNNSSRTIYSSTLVLIKDIIGCKDKLKGDGINITLLNQIALNYYKMQNNQIALQYAEKAFSLEPENIETNELLRRIKSIPKTN